MSADQLTAEQRRDAGAHLDYLRRSNRNALAQILAEALEGRALSETARNRLAIHADWLHRQSWPGRAAAIRALIAAGPPKVNSLPIGGPVATP